jgi:hypothetical protein
MDATRPEPRQPDEAAISRVRVDRSADPPAGPAAARVAGGLLLGAARAARLQGQAVINPAEGVHVEGGSPLPRPLLLPRRP